MLFGSGAMAMLALLAAGLMIYGALETARRIDQITAAQTRMELYANLSARISDYAVVAIEAANAKAITWDARNARLYSRKDVVDEAFARLETALGTYVEKAADHDERSRRATWSLGLARMRAQFNVLVRAMENADPSAGVEPLRARLDGFATQFSPLLDSALGDEQRERIAAFAAIERLRETIMRFGLGVAALAILAFVLFQAGLIAPLLRRIEATTKAARLIGGGQLRTRLDIDRRDELGLLFVNVNRMAARLDRRRASVTADRARLNETIAERTEALQIANMALEQIDGNRRRFFSDVSHELRTPLTVILGEAEIGTRSQDMSVDDYKASLHVINARARRLNRRIEDLLRIARSESGRIDLEQALFDLADAARDAIDDTAGLAARRGITVMLPVDVPHPTVGDADWIRQVLAGLLENAIRHSPDAGHIVVGLGEQEEAVTVTVTDEGEGVDASEIDGLFTRFERGTARKGAGFGVGLALAKWVMDSQGGSITLISPVHDGGGTMVTISMPRLVEEDE